MRIRLISAVSLPLLCGGCHRTVSAHTHGVEHLQQDYAAALTLDAVQHDFAPDELAVLHQQKGVGLALQISGRQFRPGQNVPLLVVYEDISASGPISSTNCDGFSIEIEDISRGTEAREQVRPCLTDMEFTQNNVALLKGNRRFLHTSLFGIRQELTEPGDYLIRAEWQSFRPHTGGFQKEDAYAAVQSNAIPIVITR
jgi:hypothetical protein